MWQVVLCSSWLLMCPAQIYCSVRAMSRIVWAQLQLIKDICTYRINSGGAPEVMPHCAQSYLTSGWLKSWGTVVWGWLGSEIPWGYSGHLTILLCALWCPPVLFMGPTHQMSPFKHRRAAKFCLLCLQTLTVNKPGKCVGNNFLASPVLYPAIILAYDPTLGS